ncbi:MAG: glucuronate isomerase [Mycobacteriales bacterium]|nr:MAG: glucuronate isomerase [Pseudonocardiales bacterium]
MRPHPDRLLPADPATRDVARSIAASTAALPIVSPHGHVDAAILADDAPFSDPASLLVTPDHYITRLLHAAGVPLDRSGVVPSDGGDVAGPREVWRTLCSHWELFRGTPSRYWLESELADVFDVEPTLRADTADAVFDALTELLSTPDFRPRALFARFGIEVLATTDDPCSELTAHARLAADAAFSGRVLPTFRPDGYLDPSTPGWPDRIRRLGVVSTVDTSSYAGYLEALHRRRAAFAVAGGTATDHGPADAGTEPLADSAAARIFAAALRGDVDSAAATAFRRHMLGEMARMSCDDGLVMQLHPSVLRGHHSPTERRFGADTGHDIPVAAEFTRALRPLLGRYGTHPNFRLVLFTTDEGTYSREIAPLAGFYPSVYVGAPWWFLDTPDAMRRFREAITDTAGFYRTAGFVDDTRAFASIPARHDAARRVDAGYLARLVVEHRLAEDEAHDVACELAYDLPKRAFRL